jgi:hypothetical protein
MAASTARTVKDVNPHEFVKAYSAHLKRSGKVTRLNSLLDAGVDSFLGRTTCVVAPRGVSMLELIVFLGRPRDVAPRCVSSRRGVLVRRRRFVLVTSL